VSSGTAGKRPFRQSSLARSMRSRECDTKFQNMWRGWLSRAPGAVSSGAPLAVGRGAAHYQAADVVFL